MCKVRHHSSQKERAEERKRWKSVNQNTIEMTHKVQTLSNNFSNFIIVQTVFVLCTMEHGNFQLRENIRGLIHPLDKQILMGVCHVTGWRNCCNNDHEVAIVAPSNECCFFFTHTLINIDDAVRVGYGLVSTMKLWLVRFLIGTTSSCL